VPDDSDDEWLEEGEEMAVAPEGEKMEVETEAGKKDEEKLDTAERDVRKECNCNENVLFCVLCANCVGGTQDLGCGWLVICGTQDLGCGWLVICGTQDLGCGWLVNRATCWAFKNVPAVFD
jgi:hypothetical protein